HRRPPPQNPPRSRLMRVAWASGSALARADTSSDWLQANPLPRHHLSCARSPTRPGPLYAPINPNPLEGGRSPWLPTAGGEAAYEARKIVHVQHRRHHTPITVRITRNLLRMRQRVPRSELIDEAHEVIDVQRRRQRTPVAV